MKIWAIIAAKGNSQRLPGKNILKIKGKRMFEHVVDLCISSKIFDKIILSSQSKIIQKYTNDKDEVMFLNRKKKLYSRKSSVADVCLDIINSLKFKKIDIFCSIYPTSILLKKKTLKKSFNVFKNSNFCALMGASKLNNSPYKAMEIKNGYWRPIFPKNVLKRVQNNYYFSNGTFYWCKVSSFLKNPTFYQKKLGVYEVRECEVSDINTKNDLKKILKTPSRHQN